MATLTEIDLDKLKEVDEETLVDWVFKAIKIERSLLKKEDYEALRVIREVRGLISQEWYDRQNLDTLNEDKGN